MECSFSTGPPTETRNLFASSEDREITTSDCSHPRAISSRAAAEPKTEAEVVVIAEKLAGIRKANLKDARLSVCGVLTTTAESHPCLRSEAPSAPGHWAE